MTMSCYIVFYFCSVIEDVRSLCLSVFIFEKLVLRDLNVSNAVSTALEVMGRGFWKRRSGIERFPDEVNVVLTMLGVSVFSCYK